MSTHCILDKVFKTSTIVNIDYSLTQTYSNVTRTLIIINDILIMVLGVYLIEYIEC